MGIAAHRAQYHLSEDKLPKYVPPPPLTLVPDAVVPQNAGRTPLTELFDSEAFYEETVKFRQRRNLSQFAMAEMSGLDVKTVRTWFDGSCRTNFSIATIIKMAILCDLSIDKYVNWEW